MVFTPRRPQKTPSKPAQAPPTEPAGRPELVELWDSDGIRNWQAYHMAGMADLISSMNLCHALFALAACGMLDRLSVDDPRTEAELLAGLNAEIGTGFLRYLSVSGVLDNHDGRYRLSQRGAALTGDISLARLGFYLEAYGPVTRNATRLLEGSARYGIDVVRDHGALGRRSGIISSISYLPIVREVLRRRAATRVIDLGCGDGSLLIRLCQSDAALRGIGIDIAPAAITAAEQQAARAGVGGRAQFAVADAFDPDTWPAESNSAELICGVGVMHEKFRDGDSAVISLLNVLARRLGDGRRLLLGEPELRYDNKENDSDFFLVHVLTAQGIPRDRAGWLAIFEQSELHCARIYTSAVAGPRTCFYELLPVQRPAPFGL